MSKLPTIPIVPIVSHYAALLLAILDEVSEGDIYPNSLMADEEKFKKYLNRISELPNNQWPQFEICQLNSKSNKCIVQAKWPKLTREDATKLLNSSKKFSLNELRLIQEALNETPVPQPLNAKTIPKITVPDKSETVSDDWESSDEEYSGWESSDWESSDWESSDWESSSC